MRRHVLLLLRIMLPVVTVRIVDMLFRSIQSESLIYDLELPRSVSKLEESEDSNQRPKQWTRDYG